MRREVEALGVEVDHSAEVVRLLREKVERERRAVARVDSDADQSQQIRLQHAMDEYNAKGENLSRTLNQLMEMKKEHVASCKGLVDAIARAEEHVNNEVRKLHKQCDVRIEQEKKAFKAGYEERLQKVLSVKSRECIEFTAKALAPEFARLRANHEREVLDVERRMRREERELRDTVDSQTQAEMDQIEVELANEFGQLLVGLREGSREELQALERDQRRRVQTVLEEGRRELEDLKQQLARRNTEPRLNGEKELQEAHSYGLKVLREARLRHSEELQMLRTTHDGEVRKLRVDFETDKRTFEEEMGLFTVESALAEETISTARRELESERDTEIRAELHQWHKESLRIERELKSRLEMERTKMSELGNLERQESSGRQRAATAEATELAVEREHLVRKLSEVSRDTESERRNLDILTVAVADREGELKRLRGEITQRENARESDDRAQEAYLRRSVSQVEEACHSVSRDIENLKQERERRLEEQREVSESELRGLDSEVKKAVAECEAKALGLRDDIQIEDARRLKLEKLIAQYKKPASVVRK